MSSRGTEDSKKTRALVGQRLMDRYVIRKRIARGGMAVVFRGEDERLRRPVCVKLFFGFDPNQPEYAVVLEHFVQEAFALSRLQHPSTLRIYDFGYLDENERTGPFFITEFADGGHLGELLAGSGGLSGDEVLRRLRPIVGALREAHAAGIVHRDLKPSNILLTSAGGELSPKLADFSIAKAHGDLPNRASETNAQAPLYSLSWAAPEQLKGDPITTATDIFALALMTSYMLTETMVYPGEDIMALYTLRGQGAKFREQAIRSLGLAPRVEAVILQASAEAPEERYPDAESFFEALESALSADPMPAKIGDDDDIPTDEHPVVTRPRPRLPSPPAAPADPRPQRVPSASLPGPERARAAGSRPRLPLATLDAAQLVVGTRRMRPVAVSDAPVALERAIAGAPAKLRITPRELGAGQVHLKGLNCFVRQIGGRPSSGIDIDRPCTIQLVEPQSRAQGSLRITMGRHADGHHEIEFSDAVVVVPAALARWVVALEASDETLLLHLPSH